MDDDDEWTPWDPDDIREEYEYKASFSDI